MGTYLSRTPGSAGNRKTMTFSCWVKRSGLGSFQSIISAGTNGATYSDDLSFQSSDKIMLDLITTSGRYQAESSALFRDPSSWYHVVIAINTTAASNRMLVYVNNEQVAVNSGGIPQNQDITFNNNTLQEIGRRGSNSSNFGNYYLADFNFIDGQALTPSTFGETDSTTGEWKPKVDFSGLTYGTNGFRLQFGNAAALGTDTSGQSNNFTVNNAGTDAKTVDTATNNFATMNPIVIFEGSNSSSNIPTYTEGNTVATADNSTTRFGMGTIATTMPYYFEVKVLSTSSTDTSQRIGVIDDSAYGSPATYSSVYRGDGSITATGESNNTGNQTLSANSIIGIAVDLATNYNIKYYHNGTLQATMAVGSSYRSLATTAFTRLVDSTQSFSFNFGNPSFAISSGNADANGYGNFEYAVPSGYYALCTKNVNQYG